ncbi:DUF4124 domain-containing protein [Neisseria perflava]|uniref:DUF4124 domain-containing protein n=1 Tax=Neisseria perflava TaxID=33053 RepID=UPI0020A0C2D0|nr:DUF4124 domain-containing protein [Neisseria perflava]MCP1659564.1 hypothetical protein [Neisseria perflava]MCP1772456.1 hypothetical protein [Neisseria perflava]
MKKISILLLSLAFVGVTQAATIYECTDKSGHKVYTQDGGGNCKASNIGKPSVYTSAPVYRAPAVSSPVREQDNSVVQKNAAVTAARQELAQAQQALEEGKKVRYGNERNYVRYLARIQGLEDAVKAAQDKLDAALAESGN